ncbi:LysR family transcriptional regulator [Vibrio astriarenae]
MYSFEQLKIFVTVSEVGSFSAAARKLGRAQSGVSQSIANLEIALNKVLFNRGKNTPTLTNSGKALLPIAKSILNQQTYFDQKVESLDNMVEDNLVIAIDECLVMQLVLDVLPNIEKQFPITHFNVITAATYDVEDLVRSNKAHVGIILADGELKEDMDFITLGQTRFLNVASPCHPLASLSVVRDSDLRSYRQIVHRSISQKELWFSYRISSNFWYANHHDLLAKLAIEGLGWALIPDSIALPLIENKQLVQLPVAHEKDGWLVTHGCLTSRRNKSGPALQRLLETLQTQ